VVNIKIEMLVIKKNIDKNIAKDIIEEGRVLDTSGGEDVGIIMDIELNTEMHIDGRLNRKDIVQEQIVILIWVEHGKLLEILIKKIKVIQIQTLTMTIKEFTNIKFL